MIIESGLLLGKNPAVHNICARENTEALTLFLVCYYRNVVAITPVLRYEDY